MAARLIYALTILVCLVLAGSADKESDIEKVARKSNKFAIELYKQTHALEPNKNLATSGSFVWILLSLLTLGSTGTSRNELKQALGIENDKKDFEARVIVPSLVESIEDIKGIVLEQATRFYIKDDGSFTTDDYDVDAYRYGVEVEPLKLNNPKAAARTINTWVAKQTHGRVKGLVSAKDLGPDSSLILVNAIFIKATWQTAFEESQTKRRPFYALDGTTVNPDTMATHDYFRYGYNKNYDAKVLAIPLKGKETFVVFVLPSKKDGLPELVQKLGANGTDIFNYALTLDEELVKARIPKAFLETSSDLKTLLPKVGINLIFQKGKSGLTYILDSGKELVVTTAAQKTVLIVDEKGENKYEAPLGTGPVYSFFTVSSQTFYVDRPYLAAVVRNDGLILHISQITNPSL